MTLTTFSRMEESSLNNLKSTNQPIIDYTIPTMIRLIILATVTASAVSAPTDYAGSFAHISSGEAPAKLTSNHFHKADQITKAAHSLRSSSKAQAIEYKSAKNRFIDSSKSALESTHAASHGVMTEHVNEVNTIRPNHVKLPKTVIKGAGIASEMAEKHYTNAIASTYHQSMLEVASTTTATSQLGMKGASDCEVCVYVVENKQMHQPFLCRGLKDPAYQQTVSFLLL
jgi:hypothetical protein